MPTANAPSFRALWIRRLLWASIPISLIAVALSLVNLAWTSFYTSPAVVVLALVFDITLLALSARERKASASPSSPKSESPLNLPSVCRAGTIVCGYLLAVFWLGVFITSIMWVVIIPPLDNPVHTEDRFPAAYVEIAFIGTHIILFSVLSTFCLLERKAIRNRRSMEPIIPHNPADPVAAELYARRIQQLLWGSLALCAVILALSLVMLASTTFYLSPASVGASAAFTVTLLVLTGRERKAAKAKAQATGIPLTQTPSKAVSTTELMAEYFAVNGNLPFTSRVPTISFGIFTTVLWLATFILSISLGVVLHTPDAQYYNRYPAAYTESAFLGIQVGVMIWLDVMFVKERRNWLGLARIMEAENAAMGNVEAGN